MIPLKDENKSGSLAIVVLAIIALNLGLFIYQSQLSSLELKGWIASLATHPREIIKLTDFPPKGFLPSPIFTLLTSVFLHGGILHLLGNMLYLWIFADNIERAMGPLRFLLFYLLCGLFANLAHIYSAPQSMTPLIGASGAISGVLGSYLLLFPGHRISTLFWFIIIFRIIPVPAFFFIGFWFLQQLLMAPTAGAVAWYAHIGGFIVGMALTPFFVKIKVSKR